jgi:hypothetical protein
MFSTRFRRLLPPLNSVCCDACAVEPVNVKASNGPLPDFGTRPDAYKRLAPLGWNAGLLFRVALLAVSFFLVGYFVVYWRNADMDFMVVYNAFLSNDGQPQFYFDHPAYFTILLVKGWFRFLHQLGLLDAWKLSAIPSSSAAAFDQAMTTAVRAGRLLSFGLAIAVVLVFAALMRRIVHDRWLAMIAVFAFASSGALAMQMRIMRTELVAAPLVVFAFLILVLAARQASNGRPLVIALAVSLCMLGLENKVHAILPIAALPLLMLPFGAVAGASTAFWKQDPRRWLATAAFAGTALVILWVSWPLIRTGFDPAAMAATLPAKSILAGRPGFYQAAVLAWTLVGMVVFSAIWKVSVAESLAAIFALAIGLGAALLALDISCYDANVVTVLNPLERMSGLADLSPLSGAGGGGLVGMLGLLVLDGARVLLRYTFVLSSSPRPAVFLIWFIVPGIVYAWRRGERQAALQAALLMLTVFAIDTVGMRRGLKDEYFIFTDPFIIIAGAVLLDGMNWLRFHRLAFPVGIVLIVLHVAVGQAEPVKRAFARKGPEGICEWRMQYLPLLQLPWCAKA